MGLRCDKRWDTKILTMTKAFEEHKRLLESEKEQLILLHQILSPSSTTVNDNNENLENTSKKTCHSREQTRNV